MTETTINELYSVANDHEATVLDKLRRRAGQTWECYGTPEKRCRWTNVAAWDTCDNCGAPKGSTTEDE
jgi:hypothetical protein